MFSIKKLTVSGPNKRDSEIVFGNRLTIIQGPSNTGKTMILNCIEYVLGGNIFQSQRIMDTILFLWR